MRAILLGVFLTCCISITAVAGEHSIIHSFLADLDQDASALIKRLQTTGCEERQDSAYQQANLHVFMKVDAGVRPVTYIIEQCNNKITGFTQPITSMEEVLLLKELERQGYKKSFLANGEKYRKGAVTIDLYYDDSRLLLARRYIHVSRKNACHTGNVASPFEAELNLRPANLGEALANLKCNRTAITLAAAKAAFASTSEPDADNTVTYKRSLQTFRIKYCHNQVKHLELELNEKEGRGLVESVEKGNFQKLKEESAANNAYTRTYAAEEYEVTVCYYGDKYGREFNENAYKIILYNKNTCM